MVAVFIEFLEMLRLVMTGLDSTKTSSRLTMQVGCMQTSNATPGDVHSANQPLSSNEQLDIANISRSFVFSGEVQMAGFRRRLVQLAIKQQLHGFVLNDNYDVNRVCAMAQGKPSAIFSFISATESLMNKLGVEMKVEEAIVVNDILPSPFFRMPNSVADEEDRFDKAIAILSEMSQTLKEMNVAVSVLPEMNKKLDRIDNKLDIMNDKLDRIDNKLDIMNGKLDRIDENTRP